MVQPESAMPVGVGPVGLGTIAEFQARAAADAYVKR